MQNTTLFSGKWFLFLALSACLLITFGTQGQVGALCTNPIVINSIPFTTTDNTGNYGDNYDPPTATPIACGAGTSGNYYLSGNDVIYSYTPTANQSITLQIPSAPAWTGMFVYTSCAGIGLPPYGCNCSSASGNRTISNLSVTAGQTYYIVISSWASPQTIAYTLNITGVLENDTFESTNFATYPNPVTDLLYVDNPSQSISALRIYNLFGQAVFQQDYSAEQQLTIDLSNLSSGTYLLAILADGRTETRKIVKK